MPRVTSVSAANGSRLPENRVASIRRYVLRLSRRRGRPITAKELLEAAHNSRSPIHDLFEWDDVLAAESYRLQQAYHILRSIKVTIEDHGQTTEVRGFFPVRIEGLRQQGYAPTERIITIPTAAEALLETALRDLRVWYDRYRNLAGAVALSRVFHEVEEALGIADEPRNTN